MMNLGLRRLAGSTATTLGRQLGAGVLQLAIIAAIARVFGPEGSGVYTLALLVPTLLSQLLNLGIAPANVYYLGSGQVTPSAAWRSTLKLYGCIVVVGLVAGSIVVLLYAEKWFPGIPKLLLWLGLLLFPVSLFLSLVVSIFQGLQQFRHLNLVLLLQPFVALVMMLILMVLGVEHIGWMLSAYVAASVITMCFSIIVLLPLLSDDGKRFTRYSAAVLGYGYKAHLSNILTFVNYRADIFLINLYVGPVGAGIYIVSVQLSERLWILSQAVSTVLLPRLSQLSGDVARRELLTPLITRWVLLLTLCAGITLALIGYPVIKLIFGEEFLGAYLPLLLVIPGTVLGAASRVLANDIAARGRPELNMYVACAVVVINVLGNLLLIPRYGIAGAAVATSIAYSADLLIRLVMHQRNTGIPMLRNVLVDRGDIIQLSAALAKRA